ncbi:MAG: tetratricopeptide repeat protein [Candidatus Omnitrophica bacterium]|nr:tetratricopeptide repeat protein [Candidatus Omnitrophota bacterium]
MISTQKNKTQSSTKAIWVSIALIAGLGFLFYASSLNGQFLWDDTHLVEENLYVRSWSNLPKFFTQGMAAGSGAPKMYSFYRPLQLISYTFDYSLWGLKVRGYHLTNIILHILAAWAVFWLINILFGDQLLSFLTAVLFVAHPVHSEAVSYISGRADSLAAIFMLLCLIFYIKDLGKSNKSYYLFSFVTYVLAVLSKETSLILPFFLLLYHYSFRKKLDFKRLLPILVITLAYIITRFSALSFLSAHISRSTTYFQRLPGFFVAFVSYIRLLILPLGLHMEYGNELFKLNNPQALLGILAIIAVLILTFRMKAGRNIFFFSLGWFLIGLIPVSNIYPLNAYMAEHWLYLPSIGFFLILARGLSYLTQQEKLKKPAIIISVTLLGFYFYSLDRQNDYWREPIAFYLKTLKYAPGSARVYYNLGNEYRSIDKNGQAIVAYKKSIELDPKDADTYYNLAKAYTSLKRPDDAMTAYNNTIKADPDYYKAYYNLGNIYYETGQLEEAQQLFKKTIQINPRHAKAHNNLGLIWARLGQRAEAEAEIKKAIAIDPDNATAYGNLAILYFQDGKTSLAADYYLRAEALGFDDPDFLRKILPYLGN